LQKKREKTKKKPKKTGKKPAKNRQKPEKRVPKVKATKYGIYHHAAATLVKVKMCLNKKNHQQSGKLRVPQ